MKKILIFAGTTEGRRLSERLCEAEVEHTVCVATEYGEIVLNENPYLTILQGRLSEEEMEKLLQEGMYQVVVDATHPYAGLVTENIRQAAEKCDVMYVRLQRDIQMCEDGEVRFFQSHEACAEALQDIQGNILLTTGSKALEIYCKEAQLRERLYVRVLPSVESLAVCEKHSIRGRQILAMQGPFTEAMNEACIRQFDISCLVTKKSGLTGGYPQKIKAAAQCRIPVFVIGAEEETEGESFQKICERLEQQCDVPIRKQEPMHISLIGVGMGAENTLTKEAETRIQRADVLLGAKRLIGPYHPRIEKKPYYRAEEILPYLEKLQHMLTGEIRVAILFSGDCGFYSGAFKVQKLLQEEIHRGTLAANLEVLPGISSISYFAAHFGIPYQSAPILSIHGKTEYHLGEKIRTNEHVFLLLSGEKDVQALGILLLEEGLEECKVLLGYQMSYPEEEFLRLTPKECVERKKEGLYTCLIENPHPEKKGLASGISDEEFLRDKVPMTKDEVRGTVIRKLQLQEGATVVDIGCGTGSVAVEMACLSDHIFVYGIEQKEEAVKLSRKNKEKFHCDNLEILEGEASEMIPKLPVLTHAFIGGTGGNLQNIIEQLYQKNHEIRIVLTAITVETFCEIQTVFQQYPIRKKEIVQLQVNRTRPIAKYQMMQAENPIWICMFQLGGEER